MRGRGRGSPSNRRSSCRRSAARRYPTDAPCPHVSTTEAARNCGRCSRSRARWRSWHVSSLLRAITARIRLRLMSWLPPVRRKWKRAAADSAVCAVPRGGNGGCYPSPAGARLITSGHPFRICTVLAETEVTHRACSAAEPAAAVFLKSHQKTHLESITWPMATLNFKSPHYLFARLGAIVSLRSCQRDQAHPRARVLLSMVGRSETGTILDHPAALALLLGKIR